MMPDKTFSSAQSRPPLPVDVGVCRRVSSCLGPLGLVSGSRMSDSVAEFAEARVPFGGAVGGSCWTR